LCCSGFPFTVFLFLFLPSSTAPLYEETKNKTKTTKYSKEKTIFPNTQRETENKPKQHKHQ